MELFLLTYGLIITLLLREGVVMPALLSRRDVKNKSSLSLNKSFETQNKSFFNQIASKNPRLNSFNCYSGYLLFDSNNIGEFFISNNYPANGIVAPVYKI